MGEVRACVYFSVIFLCLHVTVAKPFFGYEFWCELMCEDDDVSTTTSSSSEDYMDSWCNDCFPRRRRPTTTPAPQGFVNNGIFGPPGFSGIPGQPFNYVVLGTPQNGGGINFTIVPDRTLWNVSFNPAGGPAGGGSPNAPPPNGVPTPAAAPAPAATPAPAGPAAAATTAAPAAAATTAAPAAPATAGK